MFQAVVILQYRRLTQTNCVGLCNGIDKDENKTIRVREQAVWTPYKEDLSTIMPISYLRQSVRYN